MKNLKALRIEHKLSQKAFGDIFHVSQNTISQWESNTREPSNDTIQKIADYFHVTTDYLLGRSDQPNPQSLDEQLQDETFALWGEVRDLTEAEKQDVLDFIKFKKSQRDTNS